MHKEKNNQILIFGSSASVKLEILEKFHIKPDLIIHPDIDETRYRDEKPKALCQRLAFQKSIKVLSIFLENYLQKPNFSGLDNYLQNKNFSISDASEAKDIFILSLDSVVAVGNRVLEKSNTVENLMYNLELLSGRSHKVYTGFSILKIQLKKENLNDLIELCKKTLITFDLNAKLKPCNRQNKFNEAIKYMKKLGKVILKTSSTSIIFKKLTEKEIKRYICIHEANICQHSAVYRSENYGLRFIKTINGSLSGLQGLPLYEIINSLESSGFLIQ